MPAQHVGSARRASAVVGQHVRAWLALVKFRYHVTFVNVVFGACLFAAPLDVALAPRLLALYLSFNVLLYGGIYTLNDLADRGDDALHPMKRFRPIAAGTISTRAAAWLSSACITGGLVSGFWLFGAGIGGCYVLVLATNILYSAGGRNVAYLDLLLNSLPHPLRFLMGVLLVGRRPPLGHLAALLALAVALSCLRRHVERDDRAWDARPTLKTYTRRRLAVLAALSASLVPLLAVADGGSSPGFYAVVFVVAFVLLGGGFLARPVRAILRRVWVR